MQQRQRGYIPKPSDVRDGAIRATIRQIPAGSVATYAQVAAAAGYPGMARQVARVLRYATRDDLPWQRVVGAGGQIKTKRELALEQHTRLVLEGVRFRGQRADLSAHQYVFLP